MVSRTKKSEKINIGERIRSLATGFYSWVNRVVRGKLSAFLLLAGLLSAATMTVFILTVARGGYFMYSTDDYYQYYPYVGSLFEGLKNGSVSLYDATLFGGTSVFSATYYVPLDLFTGISFLLSFVMRGETAYCLVTLFRSVLGALVLYYLLIRRGKKPFTGLFVGLMYFSCGLVQSYYVFPVFAGIAFYAPLAMLVVDLCVDKGGLFYGLVPLYVAQIIFYDYYIAYMMCAFMCIYYLTSAYMTNRYSFVRGKNALWRNGTFWWAGIRFFGCVLLGVAIGACMLIPSVLYVLKNSSRNFGSMDPVWWYYTDKVDGKVVFSFRHYFTYLVSFFIPNDPRKLLLNYGTDYIRNQATFYMTMGGLMSFLGFFLSRGKEDKRLKIWIVLMNILFMMPIMACVFNFNTIPYARWMFIPFMFNFLAMAYGFDRRRTRMGKSLRGDWVTLAASGLGAGLLIYILIDAPDLFMHYKRTDDYFYWIVIPSLVLACVYFVVSGFSLLRRLLSKKMPVLSKIPVTLLLYALIILEVVYSSLVVFSHIENSSVKYYKNMDACNEFKEDLVGYGMDDTSGYRINMDVNLAKALDNANLMIVNVNCGTFFQSFYDTSLNPCLRDVFNESTSGWNWKFFQGYNVLASPLFNTKYVVTWNYKSKERYLAFSDYYRYLGENGGYVYYELDGIPPFIVYDSFVSSLTGPITKKVETLLRYAYIPSSPYEDISEIDPESDDYETKLQQFRLYQHARDSGMKEVPIALACLDLTGQHRSKTLQADEVVKDGSNTYYVYHIASLGIYDGNNAIQVFSSDKDTRKQAYDDYYILDTEGNKHEMHYATCYYKDTYRGDTDWTPDKLYVKVKSEESNKRIIFMTYNTQAYEDFLTIQSQYTGKEFSLDGDVMTIRCTMPAEDKVRIIKTGYAFSDEWKTDDHRYEVMEVDGGFLGIVVPADVKEVDVKLHFVPYGWEISTKVSFAGVLVYVVLAAIVVGCFIYKRKKAKENPRDGEKEKEEGVEHEENQHSGSVL